MEKQNCSLRRGDVSRSGAEAPIQEPPTPRAGTENEREFADKSAR
jgi:hypothetical protein